MPNKGGGQEPIWHETFTFHDLQTMLRVTLMDKKQVGSN